MRATGAVGRRSATARLFPRGAPALRFDLKVVLRFGSVTDASDYTIPVHGERGGLHHVAIEVRRDLIADDNGQCAWGPLLACLLAQAYRELVEAEALRSA